MSFSIRRLSVAIAGATLVAVTAVPGVASAQTAPSTPNLCSASGQCEVTAPEVLGEVITRPAAAGTQTEVLGESITRNNSEGLAFTGTDAAQLAAIGAGLIIAGAGTLAIARRRQTA